MSIKSLQQQLNRNRGKSAVLGGLTVVLAIMGLKAFQSLQPRPANAISPPHMAASVAQAPQAAPDSDLDKRAHQSLALWKLLREKRGLEADVAYKFDRAYYNLDPSKQHEHEPVVVDHTIVQVPDKSPQDPSDLDRVKARETHIRELARNLVLQTTMLGAHPKALITVVGGNTHEVHLNEMIDGFMVMTIESRQVTIQRDGVTLALKMGPE